MLHIIKPKYNGWRQNNKHVPTTLPIYIVVIIHNKFTETNYIHKQE